MAVGFVPRSANITLYLTGGHEGQEPLLQRPGTHRVGKGCLCVKRLSDIDEGALAELIKASVAKTAEFNVGPA